MAAILRQKMGNINGEVCRKERVVVAVKASKEVPRAALLWAVTHLVQPGDRITLLLVVSTHSSGQILRNFPRFSRECSSGCKRSKTSVNTSSFKYDLTGSCSHMICQLRDTSKMKIKVKIISGSPCGAVAAESRRVQANWVVLDKQLKSEEKKCMEELHCNIVIFKHAQPKILRLNLLQSPEREPHVFRILTPEYKNTTEDQMMNPSSSPEVGDFGLARWKPDGGLGVETQVIGSFGYLAPEYTKNAHITEKADVYSFGVVLLELLTGRRAMDIRRPKGQHRLTAWIRPLLDECAIKVLLDPNLRNNYNEKEAICMLRAASLCININPEARPLMSQVLRILEGDCFIEQSA